MIRAGISTGLQQLRQMASTAIPQIKNVDIDPSGTFKYILIKVSSPNAEGKFEDKLIVRGYAECGYHGIAQDADFLCYDCDPGHQSEQCTNPVQNAVQNTNCREKQLADPTKQNSTPLCMNAFIRFADDINNKTTEELQALKSSKAISDWRSKVLGGGRIKHDPDAKTLNVYGYSQGYGKADHKIAVDILKTQYPDYNITWSDEGY